jgi:drug/metabolite transporter (DMT)-like permease
LAAGGDRWRALLVGTDTAGADPIGVVLGLAVVSTVVPHVLFYEGVDRLEASRVGVVSTWNRW